MANVTTLELKAAVEFGVITNLKIDLWRQRLELTVYVYKHGALSVQHLSFEEVARFEWISNAKAEWELAEVTQIEIERRTESDEVIAAMELWDVARLVVSCKRVVWNDATVTAD